MEQPILEVNDLSKQYPGFELKNVSFELPSGYIMGLIGPNGAGKSTTIKIIMNLVRAASGTVKVFGLDHRQNEIRVKQDIGFVGEEAHFYEEMTVGWTARFVSRQFLNWDEDLFQKLKRKFGLDASKPVGKLSKGTRVKFALALALAHRPKLLILDEPTSGLDPIVRHELLKELLEVIQDERRSVLFSSHITQDIEKVADYVTFINDGEVVLKGAKDDVLANWRRVSFRLQRPAALGQIRDAFVCLKADGSDVVSVTDRFCAATEAELSRLGAVRMEARPMTLDEILFTLVKREVN